MTSRWAPRPIPSCRWASFASRPSAKGTSRQSRSRSPRWNSSRSSHRMRSSTGTKADSNLMMDEYRIATEREGNFQAIQEQKSALEFKQVVASYAFGDVSEGNIGEFMKLMPGVMMDYVDADVRTVSIGGMDPKYSTFIMDGAQIAIA